MIHEGKQLYHDRTENSCEYELIRPAVNKHNKIIERVIYRRAYQRNFKIQKYSTIWRYVVMLEIV